MPFCRTILQYLVLGLLASGALLSQIQAQATQRTASGNLPESAASVSKKNRGPATHKTRRSASKHTAPPAQLPPSPPQISYVDGKLSVIADNSTLSDVLNAIQNVTGAKMDGVTPTSNDRVFGKFGPALPREVCGELLSGSAYDFIIMDSPNHPGSIQEIILAARSIEAADTPSPPAAGTLKSSSETEDADDDQGMANINSANQDQAPGAPQQPQQVLPAPVQPAQIPQDQPVTQGQQSSQSEQPVAPQHPQHWGVNDPRPPQTTTQNPQ